MGPGKYLYIRVFHTATLPTRGRRGSQTPAFLEETGAAVDGSPRWCFVVPLPRAPCPTLFPASLVLISEKKSLFLPFHFVVAAAGAVFCLAPPGGKAEKCQPKKTPHKKDGYFCNFLYTAFLFPLCSRQHTWFRTRPNLRLARRCSLRRPERLSSARSGAEKDPLPYSCAKTPPQFPK